MLSLFFVVGEVTRCWTSPWDLKLALAEARSGPRQRLLGICTSTVHGQFWALIAFFGTAAHILDSLGPQRIHIGFRTPKFLFFFTNFFSIYQNFPRSCSIVTYTSITMYQGFTQYTSHGQEKEDKMGSSCTVFSAWRIAGHII